MRFRGLQVNPFSRHAFRVTSHFSGKRTCAGLRQRPNSNSLIVLCSPKQTLRRAKKEDGITRPLKIALYECEELLSGDLSLVGLLGLFSLLGALRGLFLGLDGLVHLDLEAKLLGSSLH